MSKEQLMVILREWSDVEVGHWKDGKVSLQLGVKRVVCLFSFVSTTHIIVDDVNGYFLVEKCFGFQSSNKSRAHIRSFSKINPTLWCLLMSCPSVMPL